MWATAQHNHLVSDKIRLIMQLRKRGITDTRTLGAIEAIPREVFVSEPFLDRAYEDNALPIEQNQTISQPTVVAVMTEALELSDRHVVLEIGTGSGYQAAILAKMARRVHTIERHKELHLIAKGRFEKLGLRNITPHLGDGTKGWPHAAPYDRIMVTAAAETIPTALVDQLADGGVMIVPIGKQEGEQELIRIRKQGGDITQECLLGVRFVPLVEGA